MKRRFFAMTAVTVAAVASSGLTSVSAAPSVTVSESFTAVANMTDAPLPAFVVSGFDPSDLLLVTVALDGAEAGTSLSLPVNTGLTLEYGYSAWSGVTSVGFTGSQTNANAALAAMTITTGATAGTPALEVNVALNDNDYALNPLNGHFYKFVADEDIYWQDAQAAAEATTFRGMTGHLVTITEAGENDFVTSKIEDASDVWIGASDEETEGRWKWMGGPEEGQVFWEHSCLTSPPCGGLSGTDSYSPGTPAVVTYDAWAAGVEPNNAYGSDGEDHAVTNWDGVPGEWNDLYKQFGGIDGYVVEFSTDPTSVAVSSTVLTLDGSKPTGDLGQTGFSVWLLTSVALVLIGAGLTLERPAVRR